MSASVTSDWVYLGLSLMLVFVGIYSCVSSSPKGFCIYTHEYPFFQVELERYIWI